MIASYSNNFIFLKTMKTAGTSVEAVLSTWCTGRDIVTRFKDPEDQAIRLALGGHEMNFRHGWWLWKKNFSNHQKAVVVKRRLPFLWSRAFKFTVERHPYERAVSLAYWRIYRRGGDVTSELAAELDLVANGHPALNNRKIYAIGGRIVVDEVIRYENLWQRLAEIATSMGQELPDPLPRAKTSARPDRRQAQEILSQRQKDLIYESVPHDFEELGFER